MVDPITWESSKEEVKRITENLINLRTHTYNMELTKINKENAEDLDVLYKKYFNDSEFDSPDSPGSGNIYMDVDFLRKLAAARDMAGIPFIITSGYRTKYYNSLLISKGYKASTNSAHLRGFACDIKASTSSDRFTIVLSLLSVGLNRIGIGDTFIHVDADPSKTPNLIWTY